MAAAKNSSAGLQTKETWSIVVVCEDELTHSQAVSVWDRLIKQFWAEIEFDFHWCQFANLLDPSNALDAANAAARADLIVLSTHAGEELPEHVTSWIETWLDKRENREGALIALVGREQEPSTGAMAKHLYLREVAHRANMDFLSEIPTSIRRGIPESPEWFNERAGQVGSTLGDILSRTDTPTRP
jgi:hypothetical protein